jgi:hypothetical protein
LAAGFDVGTIGVEVLRNRNQLSTGKNTGHAGEQFKQVVHGSSSGRVGAELLANANQHQGWEQVVDVAFHVVTSGGRGSGIQWVIPG